MMRSNVCFIVLAFLTGCQMAGGVSRKSCEEWLSIFVDDELARNICEDRNVSSSELLSLYHKWYVNQDIRYLIISHHQFPVEIRLKEIETGNVPMIYLVNKIRIGNISNDEILSYFKSITNECQNSTEPLYGMLGLHTLDIDVYRSAWTFYKEKRQVLPFWSWLFPNNRYFKYEGIRGTLFELEELRNNTSLPVDVRSEIEEQLKQCN